MVKAPGAELPPPKSKSSHFLTYAHRHLTAALGVLDGGDDGVVTPVGFGSRFAGGRRRPRGRQKPRVRLWWPLISDPPLLMCGHVCTLGKPRGGALFLHGLIHLCVLLHCCTVCRSELSIRRVSGPLGVLWLDGWQALTPVASPIGCNAPTPLHFVLWCRRWRCLRATEGQLISRRPQVYR